MVHFCGAIKDYSLNYFALSCPIVDSLINPSVCLMWMATYYFPRTWQFSAYFVELGSGVVLEKTQTLAFQPPVMSLPLFKGDTKLIQTTKPASPTDNNHTFKMQFHEENTFCAEFNTCEQLWRRSFPQHTG